MWKYKLFYMEPPIHMDKIPEILEFEAINFDNAYKFSKDVVENDHIEGTVILMLAQRDR